MSGRSRASQPHVMSFSPQAISRHCVALLRAIVLGGAMIAGALAADDNTIITPGASRTEPPAKSAAASVSSLSLILGVGLAAAGGWMVWRNRRGKPVGRDLRALAIEETRSLGNRQYLVVAAYEGRKFLLGVCPGRIDLLSPLDGSIRAEKSRE